MVVVMMMAVVMSKLHGTVSELYSTVRYLYSCVPMRLTSNTVFLWDRRQLICRPLTCTLTYST